MNNLLNNYNLDEIIEGILFVSGDGVEKSFIAEKLEVDIKEVESAVELLKEKYNKNSGINLITYNNKIQLSSNPDIAEQISTVLNPIREKVLTKAALETLAIIAYKQPITRLEIEEVRGVSSDYALQVLSNHKLIDVVGVKEAVGKPFLFGTTDNFLKRFQIESLDCLPDYDELIEKLKGIQEETSESLYNEFKVSQVDTFDYNNDVNEILDGEEKNLQNKVEQVINSEEKIEIPDFLKNEENIQII